MLDDTLLNARYTNVNLPNIVNAVPLEHNLWLNAFEMIFFCPQHNKLFAIFLRTIIELVICVAEVYPSINFQTLHR